MELLPEPFRTILAFVVVLGVLVFFHELGHYAAARWRGIHVEKFAIGFGRPLAAWTDKRGTDWQIGWLPLGGYVKLYGQDGAGDVTDSGDVAPAHDPRGPRFHDKPVGDRAIVVAAGPIANFILAAVLFSALFIAVGRPVGTTTVASVVDGGAAQVAGLMPGDRITALDDVPVTRFEQVQAHVQPRAGQPIRIQLLREGRELTLTATPRTRPGTEETQPVGMLGVGGGVPSYERTDPISAIWGGVTYTAEVTGQTLAGIWQMISGQRGSEEIGGPLRIAQLSGQVASLGLSSLVSFMAILSVNLALINLFPIPVLDGGHLVFYALEAIRGRPLPPRAVEYGFRAGLAVLVALFIFATWNDLASFGLFRWVGGLIG
ncbi:RIP metalloprotease RseP [Roseomonas xinghualingensis]|uniref:RIP metalloprotease RseP n=1 Tax=Roseomonas xinghualingensis TaxID=2986475 RepID=UPI0021F1207A|nr:RIP metalloprotease RseP [Roseomonas sp. SXEYE001]MCV4206786.1 RIP metalloprotease RseP [Roseomonas sp. SXEYE001]